MSESKATLRFDHREIAVIFSLFIFVSLLMFTVGILVGKGLAQAKYEGVLLHLPPGSAPAAEAEPASHPAPVIPASTSVSTDAPHGHEVAKTDEKASSKEDAKAHAEKAHEEVAVKAEAKPEEKPLELVPKTSRTDNLAGNSLREPVKSPEAEELMKNPKLRALVDNEPGLGLNDEKDAKRAAASTAPVAKLNASHQGVAKGAFTVQVGSYPGEKDAAERVETLKKLGFSHAYFSAKQWNDTKETWYRVYLGFYPDYESAKSSGRALQERGEVTNYLVRKTDAAK